MKIRTVTVELLRAGPRHNQLLSPLTQYLAVCGDAPAGRVTLPYEHRDMELRLQDLNYRIASDDDRARRERILERTGDEIAGILSQIPGLAGALNSETERADTLTQLRIVLSASELAMLPFELTKSPAADGPSGRWLALQSRVPVCITRHIRSVSAEGMRWPTSPRILFVAGPETPFDEHHRALRDALSPWGDPGGGVGDRLHVLERATLAQIAAAVTGAARAGAAFSHVHILAHGDRLDETDAHSPVGVALHDEVVAGARLTTALSAVTDAGVVRPAVVTLATCESAKIADVRTPDASVAHDLHDRGIPLVVASQFPLTVDGSVPLIARFYQGQLRGEHPLVSLYDARMLLHGRMSHHAHDWAAVVVYEAFPSDLSGQLEDLRYWQMRRAQDGALRRVEALVQPGGDAAGPADAAETARLFADADAAGTQLPESGPYALECTGLRAAGHKRLAEAAFRIAIMPGTAAARRDQLFAACLRRLDDARSAYWHASRSFLGPADLTRRKASLHWLLGQVLSLDVILGRPFNAEAWAAANLAARIEAREGDEDARAWAQAGLLELGLLGLENEKATVEQRRAHLESALRDAALLVEMLGRNADQVLATIRQLERYIKLWGNPQLADALARLGFPDREHWRGDDGLVRAAEKIVEVLRGPAAAGDATTKRRAAAPEPKASTLAREPETIVRERAPVAPESASAAPESASAASAAPAAAAAAPPSLSGASRSSTVFDIEMLPAENGDCLWIEYGDPQSPHRVVIDCGAKSTAGLLASRLNGTPLELFVLTHIDADHINGVVPLFENPALQLAVGDVWFNGWRQINRFLGVKQGEQFSDLLERRKLPWNRKMTPAGDSPPAPVVVGQSLPFYDLDGGMRLTVLSPGKAQLERMARDWKKALVELDPQKVAMLGRKPAPQPVKDLAAFKLEPLASAPARPDPSVANGSSIALLAEFDGRSVLLTGDAHADVLIQSIGQLMRERGKDGQKLKLDAIKLSHHGSGNATTIALLQVLDCGRYLVSTNGNIFNHPDREAIARVILHGGKAPTLCFNYRSAMNALWGEPILRERYGYATEYPAAEGAGLRVRL